MNNFSDIFYTFLFFKMIETNILLILIASIISVISLFHCHYDKSKGSICECNSNKDDTERITTLLRVKTFFKKKNMESQSHIVV